ncbi:MAG: Hsp20/alpha crystallin family protein [Euryarchaeota archaeon]|nr:Hsp20/alpha crystallin family protein [Euryarchaeota archaeon]
MLRRRSLIELLDEMQKRIEDSFEEFFEMFRERPSWDISRGCFEPLTDVIETQNEVIVTADLPNVAKENIKIHSTEDTLEIEATMRRGIRFERWGTIQREVEFCAFHKSMKLPAKVEPEKAKAKFKMGILEIHIPKQVKRISVKIE